MWMQMQIDTNGQCKTRDVDYQKNDSPNLNTAATWMRYALWVAYPCLAR